MKNLLLVLIFISSTNSFSQEQDNYKEVASKFQTLFNAEDYESIFNMYDDNMKSALPLEKSNAFFAQNLRAGLGKILTMEFYKTKQTAYIYKTTFENGIFDILISLDQNNAINGLYVSPYKPDNLPKLERNITKMMLPFNEEWFVFWGGISVEQNYHVAYENQKGAFDLVIVKNGKTHVGDSKLNESYFVFGKEIIAPCDAKVVKVITGVHDNIPGELNPKQVTGNTVVLETANKEYILFAHFKEKSIVVKEGQYVKKGDLLGLCGNSGNSSEPHLHLSLQNVKDMNMATGAKLFFEKIKVNGEIKENYLPVKNDKIQNIKL
ncbi:MAG: peptidase M23 [Bacteroidetes bacterium]|nr:MAG: peptidase M23 [Bacteroidota bacterium]